MPFQVLSHLGNTFPQLSPGEASWSWCGQVHCLLDKKMTGWPGPERGDEWS